GAPNSHWGQSRNRGIIGNRTVALTSPSIQPLRAIAMKDLKAVLGHRTPRWDIDPSTTYLNHGSVGPSPPPVQEARNRWSALLERQPMEFFLRRMEPELTAAAQKLGDFVGAEAADLCFVDNATTAMNIVAETVPLGPGDEVLFTNHEYGAV